MKKIVLLLLLFFSTPLLAKWSYYMIDLTRISGANKTTIINKLNTETNDKYTALRYYLLNNTSLANSTRVIIECPDKIENFALMQTLLGNGIVQKIMTREYIEINGNKSSKETILLDYLHASTSWYLVNGDTE